MTLKIKTLLIFILSISTVHIQAQDTIVGSWEGTLTIQETELPIIIHISASNGNFSSTMDSPNQGATGIPMDETTVKNNEVTITFTQAGIKYVGTLKDGEISGTFYQNGLELPLVLSPKQE